MKNEKYHFWDDATIFATAKTKAINAEREK